SWTRRFGRTCAVALLCITAAAQSMKAEPLTRAEKEKALQAEQAAVQTTARDFLSKPAIRDFANSVTAGPQYVTSISSMPRPQPGMPRVAQVTRYQYAGGITVH